MFNSYFSGCNILIASRSTFMLSVTVHFSPCGCAWSVVTWCWLGGCHDMTGVPSPGPASIPGHQWALGTAGIWHQELVTKNVVIMCVVTPLRPDSKLVMPAIRGDWLSLSVTSVVRLGAGHGLMMQRDRAEPGMSVTRNNISLTTSQLSITVQDYNEFQFSTKCTEFCSMWNISIISYLIVT